MNTKNTAMKNTTKRLFSIGLMLLVMLMHSNASAQDACMMVPLPLSQRVQQSSVIVEGKVLSQESFWGIGRRNIFTRNVVEVYKVFKGTGNLRTIEVITQGGKVGDVEQVLSANLSLTVGDMGILTCIPSPYQEAGVPGYAAYGSMQGFIKYDDSAKAHDPFSTYRNIDTEVYQAIKDITRRPVQELAPNTTLETLRRSLNANTNRVSNPNSVQATPTITNFTPTSITSGTSSNLTINGTNFGATQGTGFVEFKNANDGGTTWIKPLTTDYVSWSNTQIVVKVPSVSQTGPGAGTGQVRVTNSDASSNQVTSAATLTITYAYSNSTNANVARMPTHITDNGFGGYTFSMNTSFASNTSAANKFRAILNTWTCASGINWLLGATTAASSVASDGINVVTFVPSLSAGVLASCSSWYYSCGSGAASSVYVGEIDVVISSAFTWYYGTGTPPGGQYDFESVMLHEMGHGHQLNHSIDAAAVMHYSISSGTFKRTLNANEIAGAIFIKNRDITIGTVCGSALPMTVLACNAGTSAPLVTFTANRTNVVAGCSSVTFTPEAIPEVTSWSWNFGGGATNSTLQNPTVTFSTPGTYSVTLTATNAYGATPFTRTNYITVTAPICSATNTNFTGTPSDYSVAGGRLAGHNGAGDLAFADKFLYCGVATKLTQLKYYFNLRTGTGNITAKVWSADGANGAPGTELFSQTVAISALQAYPNATTVTLPSPLSITGDYYIGYQIAYAGSDAVSLITNAQGESAVSSGWRKSSTNVWASYLTLYGLSLTLKVEGVFNNTPTATITPASATTFCTGGSVVLNANTAPGYTYLWYKGGVTTGITTSSYTATTAGNYTVQVSYGTCSVTSAATAVTVNNCANADLANLTINTGTLAPTFAAATIAYTVSVPNATSSMTVTPTLSDVLALVKVNGVTVASGSPSSAIALSVGSNVITTVVTAQNGTTTKTYTITVTRAASNNANLSNLVPNSGILTPAFAQATIAYTISVPNTTTSMTVTPTVADATATVKVNTVTVASGSPSSAIALSVGSNVITTVVTAQDGTTTKTYTITVTRAASNNANLSNLVPNSGILTPAFAQATIAYTISVPNTTTSMTVTPTVADATATVKVNTVTVASGSPSSAIALSVGSNVITTVVTAQDGTTTKTYTITVTRAASNNANLSNLVPNSGILTPAFAQATIAYTISVPNTTTSMTVTPTVADATATVKVNTVTVASGIPSSAIALSVGSNVITTVVTAQDGTTTKTYTITVTRAASNVTTLSNLVVSAGALSPSFASLTTSYTVSVPNATTSTTVTPTLTDSNAVVRVNGVIVSSGTASSAIALNVGANVITTLVTAQDGVSTRTYTVTVTRAASNVTTLSNLVVSAGALSPSFASLTTSYTVSVPNATTSTTVTPTLTDSNAVVRVNGVIVSSGTASSAIALNVGANVITTLVTAQDGVSTRTYSITVTRAAATNTVVNLKLFIEGYYVGSGFMNSVKFNQDGFSNTTFVEDLTIELRHATTLALIASTTATLKTDGTMVCSFSTSPAGSYYIVVKGRNMIETWSGTPQTVGGVPATYDFSDSASKAYGSNMATVAPGVFACYSGDLNQDGIVEFTDYTIWEADANEFASGDHLTDLNGDGQVEFTDYTIWEAAANNFISVVTP